MSEECLSEILSTVPKRVTGSLSPLDYDFQRYTSRLVISKALIVASNLDQHSAAAG